jgi:hypothetical protein
MNTSVLPSMSVLQQYRRSIYSQNGEDGVIAELIRRLGIGNGWFCEFGAWDGRYGSNCYALLRQGWSGVMIEGEPARCVALQRLANRYPGRLHAIEAFVSHQPGTPESLDRLLARTPIPQNFDVLSIDIDGLDYQVWRTLEAYRPVIVIIEIDSSIPPGPELIHGDGSNTSFSAMLKLGQDKGYRLAAHTGNMIFVRADHMEKVRLPAGELADPERLFVPEWVNPSRWQVLRRKLRYASPQRVLVKIQNSLGPVAERLNPSRWQVLRRKVRYASPQQVLVRIQNSLRP